MAERLAMLSLLEDEMHERQSASIKLPQISMKNYCKKLSVLTQC